MSLLKQNTDEFSKLIKNDTDTIFVKLNKIEQEIRFFGDDIKIFR